MAFWLFILSSVSICDTKEIFYEFNISYFKGAPDGVTVNILGVNNQYPGPTIRATIYDILTIKVTNQIQDRQSTTIHWHGLDQYLTPFVDGPRMITQCDIPFNSSFIYRFQVNQAGTYWYHSHYTLQSAEGLWGVLIIDNEPEVYNYDGEIVIAASSWYHISGKKQFEWYMDMEKSHGLLPVPDSNLINGVGYYPCEYAKKKNMSCEPANKDRYVMFEVERGKTYRIRYLNPSPVSVYHLSIDEHKLILIETDGVDTVMGNPVDEANIPTGARDSFLLTMDGDKDQYWIRFKCDQISIKASHIPNINPFPEVYFGCLNMLAVLKYKPVTDTANVTSKSLVSVEAVQGRPEKHDHQLLLDMKKNANGRLDFRLRNEVKNATGMESDLGALDDVMKPMFAYAPFPTTVSLPNLINIMHGSARPIGDERAPDYFNQTIVINVANQDDPNIPNHRGGFNNITYDTSTLDKPALFKALLGEKLPESLQPIKINGFGSDYVVEVIFNDFGDTGHPIHLHGHTFWIMGRGAPHSGPFIEGLHRPTFAPVTRRETASVFLRSWLALRFRADNPGVWLMHCHIVHHLEIAMGLVFEEGLEEARAIYKIPQESIELCKRNGIDLDVDVTPSNVASNVVVDNVLVALSLFLLNGKLLKW